MSDKNSLIIAEIGQAHDGSLGTAHAYIDAVANAGADAIKFQTHIAAAESTPDEPWRIRFSPQDETRYEYWQRMEFTEPQWHGLKKHATERGLHFLSSPFSIEAVELLKRVGIYAWKIASGEVRNEPMFARMVDTKLPFFLSTGMSTLDEIDETVALVQRHNLPLTLFQCTSMYPTPPEKIGLNMLPFFRERYNCQVGLSDHSGTVYAGLAAAAMGMDALEIHVTMSREAFGPDVSTSITTAELKTVVDGIRFIEKIQANPVNKNEVAEELSTMRGLFMKSIVFRQDLPAGTILSEADLGAKKPGTGIPAPRLPEFIGRRLRQAVKRDERLSEELLENPGK